MRLKARIEREPLLNLLTIITSLERVGKRCVLFLTEDKVNIAIVESNAEALRGYAEISANDIFLDYRIASNNENTIMLQLSVDHLSKALASGRNALECTIKLVKRQDQPCLAFEAKASGGLTVDILHDIPILLMKVTDLHYYLPPPMAPPSVALILNRTKLIRNIIDKMNKFSKTVDITAYQNGRLIFHIDGACTISTYVNNLTPSYEGDLTEQEHIGNMSQVVVDNRKLSVLLNVIPTIHSNPPTLCKFIYLSILIYTILI